MCAVPLKPLKLVFLLLLLCSSISVLPAQVVPAAYGSGIIVSAGAEGSVFQPDYADRGLAETSPNRLYGVGGWVDTRFTRWVQIEAEAHWLQFNEYRGFDNSSRPIGENTYMIGPKVPIINFHGWQPYGKFLIGWGSGPGGWLTGRAGTLAYGGGVDFRLTRRITIRPIDIEYQEWRVNPTLWPYGGSAGISYTIFGGSR
jgi:hypothetical protein